MLCISDKNKFTLCRLFFNICALFEYIIFDCLRFGVSPVSLLCSCVNKSLLYLYSETLLVFFPFISAYIHGKIPSERYQLQSILLMRNACLNSDYGSKLIAYLYAVNLRIYIKIYFVQFDFRFFLLFLF